ncbi:MAG: serine protease [bacterium]|nr:serine protease [bacterium]
MPVLEWDFMTDLAVLGPVEAAASPLSLEDGEGMAPGEELLVVGYPGEQELSPQPTIARGILSRLREWESFGMTLLQTDATIDSGQSGGALIDSEGRVVGITTFGLGGFGLALSASDVANVVESMLETSQSRRLSWSSSGSFQFDLDLNHLWDTRSFVIEGMAGSTLEVDVEGPGDGMITVSGPSGLPATVFDATYSGVEAAVVELDTDGHYFLRVELAAGGPSSFVLLSNTELFPVSDHEDGLSIAVGETIVGAIDYPGDSDWFSIHLQEGDRVKISTDSLTVDTVVFVSAEAVDSVFEYDDDSAGGVFGLDAEVVFEAPHAGEYFVVIAEVWDSDFGGYYLTVEPVTDGT